MRGSLMLALLAVPALTSAQSATACPGSDPARAEALNPRIRALYERATGDRRLGRRELEEVIALGTEQCRAGDDRGLVWRAAARYALTCGGDAACEPSDAGTRTALRGAVRDLDDYLAAHPRGSLNRGQLEFITPLDVGLARYVAQVQVITRPPDAVVRVDDTPLREGAVLRTVGVVTVIASSERHETATLALTLEAGTTTSLAIVEGPDEAVPAGARRVLLERRTPLPPVPPSSPPPVLGEATASGPFMVVDAPPRPLRPWAVAAAVTAGAFAITGVGFTAWRQERGGTYLSSGCGSTSVEAACISVYDEFDTAKSLQLASFVTAGVFAGGAVALWLLDRRDTGRTQRRASGLVGCVPLVGGIRCFW